MGGPTVSAVNNEVTLLADKKPADAVKAKSVTQKPVAPTVGLNRKSFLAFVSGICSIRASLKGVADA